MILGLPLRTGSQVSKDEAIKDWSIDTSNINVDSVIYDNPRDEVFNNFL